MSILLIRPKEKFQQSTKYLQQNGIDAVGVALQCIEPRANSLEALFADTQAALTECMVIVVSPNAAMQLQDNADLYSQNISWYAVGKSTAKTLQTNTSIALDIVTPSPETSEGLLSLPQLGQVKEKNIAIIKGKYGRTTLEETLIARGANVKVYELYERVPLHQPLSTTPWHSKDIELIVATSTEAIQIAWETFEQKWLISTPWLVVSRRLVDFTAKLGIKNANCSTGASDKQLNDAIKQFLER